MRATTVKSALKSRANEGDSDDDTECTELKSNVRNLRIPLGEITEETTVDSNPNNKEKTSSGQEILENLGITAESLNQPKTSAQKPFERLSVPLSQRTVGLLKKQYEARRQNRSSYIDLCSFVTFFVIYLVVLSLQSKSDVRFELADAIRTDLVPKDNMDDPETIFQGAADVYDWISTTMTKFWNDPVCGDGSCDPPFETSSFEQFGCLFDCGRKDTSAVYLFLEVNPKDEWSDPMFVTYNLCHKTETLNKYQDYAPVCIWDEDQNFPESGSVSETFALPDGEWEVRLGNVGGNGAIVFGGVSVGADTQTIPEVSQEDGSVVEDQADYGYDSDQNIGGYDEDEEDTDSESVFKRRKILSFIGTPTSTEQEKRVRSRLLMQMPPESGNESPGESVEGSATNSTALNMSDWSQWEDRITQNLEEYPIVIGSYYLCALIAHNVFDNLPISCTSGDTATDDCFDDYFLDLLEYHCFCSSAMFFSVDNIHTVLDIIPVIEGYQRRMSREGVHIDFIYGSSCPIDSPVRHLELPNEAACLLEISYHQNDAIIHDNCKPSANSLCCLATKSFFTNECHCSDAVSSMLSSMVMEDMKHVYRDCGRNSSLFETCTTNPASLKYFNMTNEEAKAVQLFRNMHFYREVELAQNMDALDDSVKNSEQTQSYFEFCQVDSQPISCEVHFYQYFSEIADNYEVALADCPFKYFVHVCDQSSISACGSTTIPGEGRYDQIMEKLRLLLIVFCLDTPKIPCDQIDAEVQSSASVIQAHIRSCALASPQCFFHVEQKKSESILADYFQFASPWILHIEFMDYLVDGGSRVNMTCEQTVALLRSIDEYFNVLCRDATYLADDPVVVFKDPYLYRVNLCDLHSDCGPEMFCALLKSDQDTNATCMPCWHCCSYEGDNFMSSLQMLGSEPGCGHCDCDTPCSRGCSVEQRLSSSCEPDCMTPECSWSYGHCQNSLRNQDLFCYSDDPAVHYYAQVSEEIGVCCSVGGARSETLSFGIYSHSSTGDPNPLNLNETVPTQSQVFDRRIANSNVILGGMLLHAVRYESRERCEYTDRFHHLYSSCRGSPSTLPYGVDPVFQSGTSLFNPDTVANLPLFYKSDGDLNQFGVPYGFRYEEMKGLPDGYPVLMDVNLDARRTEDWVTYLIEGNYLTDVKSFTVHLVTFNADDGLFAQIRLNFEFARSGAINLSNSIQVFAVEMYVKDWYLRVALELLYVVFWFANVFAEVYECLDIGYHNYFTKSTNLLDNVSLLMGGTVICMWCFINFESARLFSIEARYHVYEDMYSDGNWQKLANDGDGLRKMAADFHELTMLQNYYQVYTIVNCMNITLMIFRLLRLMDFHPDIGMITRTIREAWSDLVNFTALALCVIVIYSFMAFITLGPEVSEFRTLSSSFQTCLLFMVGEFGELGDASQMRKLGVSTKVSLVILFWTYMVLVFLILLSALLAIIVAAMDRIKDSDRESTHIFQELMDMSVYCWRKLMAFLPGNKAEEGYVAKFMSDLNIRLEEQHDNITDSSDNLDSLGEQVLHVDYDALDKLQLEHAIGEACKLASSSKDHSTISVEKTDRISQMAENALQHFGEDKAEVEEKIEKMFVKDQKRYRTLKTVSDERWKRELTEEVRQLSSRLESTLVSHLKAIEDKMERRFVALSQATNIPLENSSEQTNGSERPKTTKRSKKKLEDGRSHKTSKGKSIDKDGPYEGVSEGLVDPNEMPRCSAYNPLAIFGYK